MQCLLSTDNIYKERKVVKEKKILGSLKTLLEMFPWANKILTMAKAEYFPISLYMNIVYFGVNIQNSGKSTYWSDK